MLDSRIALCTAFERGWRYAFAKEFIHLLISPLITPFTVIKQQKNAVFFFSAQLKNQRSKDIENIIEVLNRF